MSAKSAYNNLSYNLIQQVGFKSFLNSDLNKTPISLKLNSDDSLEFFIDKEPYEKSQFGQDKHKVYLFKNNQAYYLGDIRKFKNGDLLSYLRLDNIKKVNMSNELSKIYKVEYMRELNNKEKEILDEELNRNVIERDLMADEITYKEKIIKEL